MADKSELLPCPFCASAKVECCYGLGATYLVECSSCETSGPRSMDRSIAIQSWNTRASLQPATRTAGEAATPTTDRFWGDGVKAVPATGGDAVAGDAKMKTAYDALDAVAEFMRKDVQSGDSDLWTPEYEELHDKIIVARDTLRSPDVSGDVQAARTREPEVREEMRESGTADAFEDADFAILYRELPESGTTTLQEITNVPQVFCQEIARQLRNVAQGKGEPSPLAWLAEHKNFELSFSGWGEDPAWLVHSVNGGRNDREWTLLATGDTPDEALRKAMAATSTEGKSTDPELPYLKVGLDGY